jgi:hypothetical protein
MWKTDLASQAAAGSNGSGGGCHVACPPSHRSRAARTRPPSCIPVILVSSHLLFCSSVVPAAAPTVGRQLKVPPAELDEKVVPNVVHVLEGVHCRVAHLIAEAVLALVGVVVVVMVVVVMMMVMVMVALVAVVAVVAVVALVRAGRVGACLDERAVVPVRVPVCRWRRRGVLGFGWILNRKDQDLDNDVWESCGSVRLSLCD